MSRNFSDEIQRLRYWQGQKLKSKDFQDQLSYNLLLQAWHNRALHDAYGVRTGLQVSLENDEVVIKSGVVYDIHGHELVLEEDSCFGLPSQIPQNGLFLVVQRKSPDGPDMTISLLQFKWQDTLRFNPHDGVALARLLPGPALDRYFNLPVARPVSEPRRFYSDSLENTKWQDWVLDDDQNSEGLKHVLGLQVDVDTSTAGFTKTPCYFVWFSGDLWSSDLPAKYLEKAPRGDFPLRDHLRLGWTAIQIMVMRFGHITEPTPTGFKYYLWMPNALIPPLREIIIDDLFALARQNRFTLNWLGIQRDHEIKENYEHTGQNPHD